MIKVGIYGTWSWHLIPTNDRTFFSWNHYQTYDICNSTMWITFSSLLLFKIAKSLLVYTQKILKIFDIKLIPWNNIYLIFKSGCTLKIPTTYFLNCWSSIKYIWQKYLSKWNKEATFVLVGIWLVVTEMLHRDLIIISILLGLDYHKMYMDGGKRFIR